MPRCLLALLLLLGLTGFSGYTAKPVKVKDADTFVLDVEIWPNIHNYVEVRLLHVDAPETRRGTKDGQRIPDCEIALGEEATLFVKMLFAKNPTVLLSIEPQADSFGRWLGSIEINGEDLGQLLLSTGYARPYDGKATRTIWDCD